MGAKSIIIVGSILVAFGVIVYFMPGDTSKTDAVIWVSIIGGIILFGLIVNFIRKKLGSQ